MRVVGYVRLSRDEDKEHYSSIVEQKTMIQSYCKEEGYQLLHIYIDDNYSGYTFKRPALKEMLYEVDKGEIDLILAKDLSRIGRKNGSVLMLIDSLLDKGIDLRLLRERNGVQSIRDDDDMMGIQTWFNEMYVKDISRKIRANMESKQRKGTLIMSVPYGYQLLHKQVVEDSEVSWVVKRVYDWYLEGAGYRKISERLNELGVMTPSIYKKANALRDKGKIYKTKTNPQWQTTMVKDMLSNDFYCGIHRTHKYAVKRIKEKAKRVSEEEQYVFPDHHLALISTMLFKSVQQERNKRNRQHFKGKKKQEYVFSGLMYCGECQSPMTGRVRYNKVQVVGYNCCQYVNNGNRLCSNHFLDEKQIISMLEPVYQILIKCYEKRCKRGIPTKNKHGIYKKDPILSKTTLLDKLTKEKEELDSLIELKLKAKLSKESRGVTQQLEESYQRLIDGKLKVVQHLEVCLREQENEFKVYDTDSARDNESLGHTNEIIVHNVAPKSFKSFEEVIKKRQFMNTFIKKVIYYRRGREGIIYYKLNHKIETLHT